MSGTLSRICCSGLLCCGSLQAVEEPGQFGDAPIAVQEYAEVRLRTVRLRIEPTDSGKSGECMALQADDLQVTLRGERLAGRIPLSLERERQPALHALLIDTSESMIGRLEYAREAAAEYIARLRPALDRAFIISFDDSVTLTQAVTDDRELLRESLDRIHLGGATALIDSLYFGLRELAAHGERSVVVLLTDGIDTGSFYEWRDIRLLTQEDPALTIFVIGIGLPKLQAGKTYARKFLQRAAARTNGKFFAVHTGGGLNDVFLKIREMLDNEAVLLFTDPDPLAEPGRVQVDSLNANCRIKVFRKGSAVRPPLPTDGPATGFPLTLPLPAAVLSGNSRRLAGGPAATPECRAEAARRRDSLLDEETQPWFLVADQGRIHGCYLDTVMDHGPLYANDVFTRYRELMHAHELQTRPFSFEIRPLEKLAREPAELLDELGRFALSVAGDWPKPDFMKRRVGEHARPYRDYQGLSHGRTLMESRALFAAGLYAYPQYRAWVREKLREDGERALLRLEERARAAAPAQSAEDLQQIARWTKLGQQILARADTPTEADLKRYLSAWLGDIPAHDLFVRWESLRLDRLLRGNGSEPPQDRFIDEWRELRLIFHVPSYARVLTLLSPVYDSSSERIGFWRVVLPRLAWFMPRARGYKHHPEWTDLPLDLVPDRPFGYWIVARMLEDDAELFRHLRDRGYRVERINYRLRGKANRWSPQRAFRSASVTVVLAAAQLQAGGEPARFTLIAEVGIDRAHTAPHSGELDLAVAGDPLLAGLIADH